MPLTRRVVVTCTDVRASFAAYAATHSTPSPPLTSLPPEIRAGSPAAKQLLGAAAGECIEGGRAGGMSGREWCEDGW